MAGMHHKKFGPKKDFRKDFKKDTEKTSTPAWLRSLMALRTEKGREKENRFIAEGVNCVDEIITHHADTIVKLYYLEDLEKEAIVKKMKATDLPTSSITAKDMEKIAGTKTSQGVFAVCNSEAARVDWNTARMVTLVDAVQDPGNLGAIFRPSVGFGMDAMVLGTGTVNPFNPRCVRGSSGTFLRVPFETRVDLAERIQFLRSKGFSIVATSLHAVHSLDNLPKLNKRIAILIGNEGAGAATKYVDLADSIIRIPMMNNLESLNVSVAHGILAYDLAKLTK